MGIQVVLPMRDMKHLYYRMAYEYFLLGLPFLDGSGGLLIFIPMSMN